jgi:Tfp pilus assembly protein PilZ
MELIIKFAKLCPEEVYSMSDKRNSVRKNRRLRLRYGDAEPNRVGFICDVSSGGFFIQTSMVVRPGTVLEIELSLPDTTPILLKGRVQWAKKVPPNLLAKVRKGGMGVRILGFHSGEEHYHSYFAGL